MSDFAELFGEELVLLIFSFLPPKDLLRVRLVNQTWHRIALDGQLWKILCKEGGRKEVLPFVRSYYKSKHMPVPWRSVYEALHYPHRFSDTEKSEEITISDEHRVATATKYQNVSVKCQDRIYPFGAQPFYYYQIKVLVKHYTHMSIGITDREWEYTGNLVGFGRNSYNYAYHSNGLLLHDSNSKQIKAPIYKTGDTVGILVQCSPNDDLKSSEEADADEEIPRGPVPHYLGEDAKAEPSTSTPPKPVDDQTKRKDRLIMHLFHNGKWCHTWMGIQTPPFPELSFTVALNGDGSSVALDRGSATAPDSCEDRDLQSGPVTTKIKSS